MKPAWCCSLALAAWLVVAPAASADPGNELIDAAYRGDLEQVATRRHQRSRKTVSTPV